MKTKSKFDPDSIYLYLLTTIGCTYGGLTEFLSLPRCIKTLT